MLLYMGITMDSLEAKAANLISVQDATKILPFSKWRLYDMVRKQELPAIKLGGTIFFKRTELERILETGTLPNQTPVIQQKEQQ
jgi:excisionase family DNA binding protein